MSDRREQWTPRFRAVAAAQVRYLYLLAISGVFFVALWLPLRTEQWGSPHHIKFPVIDLEVDSWSLVLAGPATLSFIALAAFGSFRALQAAWKLMEDKDDPRSFEQQDVRPTIIDMAFYAAEPKTLIGRLGFFTYPFFVTLFFFEACWLSYDVLRTLRTSHLLSLGRILLLLTPVLAVPGLVVMWRRKVAQIRPTPGGARPA